MNRVASVRQSLREFKMRDSIKIDMEYFKGRYPKVEGKNGERIYRSEALLEELAEQFRAEGDWKREISVAEKPSSNPLSLWVDLVMTLTIFGAGAEGEDIVYTANNADGFVEQRYGGSDEVVYVIASHPVVDRLLVHCSERRSGGIKPNSKIPSFIHNALRRA
jgi:hypothetical protein